MFHDGTRELRLEAATYYDERGILQPHIVTSLDRSPVALAFPGKRPTRLQGPGARRVRCRRFPNDTQRRAAGRLLCAAVDTARHAWSAEHRQPPRERIFAGGNRSVERHRRASRDRRREYAGLPGDLRPEEPVDGRKAVSRRGGHLAARLQRDRRREPRIELDPSADPGCRADGRHGSAARGNGDREGTPGEGASRSEPAARGADSSASMERRYPSAWWKASCSVTKRARSRVRSRRKPGASNWRTGAPCSWTRSAKCLRTAAQAAARAAGTRVRAPGRTKNAAHRRQADRGHQPELGGDGSDPTFRSDLYYRLSVFPIRARRCANAGMTSRLVRHFVQQFARAVRREASRRSRRPPWPRCKSRIGPATFASCRT